MQKSLKNNINTNTEYCGFIYFCWY